MIPNSLHVVERCLANINFWAPCLVVCSCLQANLATNVTNYANTRRWKARQTVSVAYSFPLSCRRSITFGPSLRCFQFSSVLLFPAVPLLPRLCGLAQYIYTEQPNCRKRDVLLNVFANIILPRALCLRPSGCTEANINMDVHLDVLWVSRSELLHLRQLPVFL